MTNETNLVLIDIKGFISDICNTTGGAERRVLQTLKNHLINLRNYITLYDGVRLSNINIILNIVEEIENELLILSSENIETFDLKVFDNFIKDTDFTSLIESNIVASLGTQVSGSGLLISLQGFVADLIKDGSLESSVILATTKISEIILNMENNNGINTENQTVIYQLIEDVNVACGDFPREIDDECITERVKAFFGESSNFGICNFDKYKLPCVELFNEDIKKLGLVESSVLIDLANKLNDIDDIENGVSLYNINDIKLILSEISEKLRMIPIISQENLVHFLDLTYEILEISNQVEDIDKDWITPNILELEDDYTISDKLLNSSKKGKYYINPNSEIEKSEIKDPLPR